MAMAMDMTIDTNDYSESEVTYVREAIEKMSKFNQLEVLRILKSDQDIHLNENKYGIHVNLTEVRKEIIQKLVTYINYVNTQEKNLSQDEKQKEDIKNTFFAKKS